MSSLARELIYQNRRNRAPFLDLGNCDLTEIPEEVGQLEWLDGLSLGTERWETDWSLGGSIKSQNGGEPNKIFDLTPISNLTRLQLLSLRETKVASLAPLSAFRNLRVLDISNTPVSDLNPLRDLKHLEMLAAWGSAVIDLAPLAGIHSLRVLNLSRTDVSGTCTHWPSCKL